MSPTFPALLAILLGGTILPYFRLRPNRTATGRGIPLGELYPAAALVIGGLALVLLVLISIHLLSTTGNRRNKSEGTDSVILDRVLPLLALLLPSGLLILLSAGSSRLASGAAAATRISFGSGFWLMLAGSWLILRSTVGRKSPGSGTFRRHLPALAGILALTTLCALGVTGGLANLAISREFQSRRNIFTEALIRHISYAFFPSLLAAFIAFPLGRAAATRRGAERPLFALATAVQTVPTLSLLGLLVLPLSALRASIPALSSIGVSGTGWAPASIVLFLYAILPIAASARAGFSLVSTVAKDAARGLGMNDRELFYRVELPLAAPSLISGFRIAIAQNLGNAILAGLIGGGGLGSLVFLGLAQAAPDLILLGSLPVVVAAFLTDRLLGGLEAIAERKAGRDPIHHEEKKAA